MAINFTQTDAASSVCNQTTEAVSCSGRSAGAGNPVARVCSDGGTAGSTPLDAFLASSASNVVLYNFDCTVAAGVTWASGTWTVRLNVTTANMNLTVTEIYVCRVNSACVNQETIGSATGLSISLGTTGVKSQTVSGSAVTPSVGDRVMVVIVASNGAMSNQTVTITPNQNIDSPFTAPSDNGAGAASGTGTASATGASTAASPASASGTGAASATGRSTAEAVGASSGAGAAAATGETINIQSATGAASGDGASAAVGSSTAAATAAGAGTGTAAATGSSTAAAVAAPAGAGTALAAGSATSASIGAAAGAGAAAAEGTTPGSVSEATGAASGASAAGAVGAATTSGAGEAIGIGNASGIAEQIAVVTAAHSGLMANVGRLMGR